MYSSAESALLLQEPLDAILQTTGGDILLAVPFRQCHLAHRVDRDS